MMETASTTITAAPGYFKRLTRVVSKIFLHIVGVTQSGPRQNVGRRTGVLIPALVVIALWQQSFQGTPNRIPANYKVRASRGLATHQLSKFFYFFHNLGLFPAAILESIDNRGGYPIIRLAEPVVNTPDGAYDEIARNGRRLVMDAGWTIWVGERARIFLYYVDALLRKTTHDLSVRPASALFFVSGLCVLFAAFWWARQPVLGAALTFLIGSDPFQLYEVYVRENVFGLSISAAVWLLAIQVPLMGWVPLPQCYRWIAPVLSGVMLGTLRHVRSEPTVLIASVALTSLTMPRTGWRTRCAATGLLVVSFGMTAIGWSTYFDRLSIRAGAVIAAVGGHVYPGPTQSHHPVWHPIWCGLGDFDTKYGYRWDDRAAYAYALPILRQRYRQEISSANEGRYFLDTYWDEEKVYPRLVEDVAHYTEVIREKVLRDITGDPLWYGRILANRAWRILSETTPVQLAVGPWHVTLFSLGWLWLPVVVVLSGLRNWPAVKLLVFFLPLSFPAFLIYSGMGMNYYSCCHLAAAAMVGTVAAQETIFLSSILPWLYRQRN